MSRGRSCIPGVNGGHRASESVLISCLASMSVCDSLVFVCVLLDNPRIRYYLFYLPRDRKQLSIYISFGYEFFKKTSLGLILLLLLLPYSYSRGISFLRFGFLALD